MKTYVRWGKKILLALGLLLAAPAPAAVPLAGFVTARGDQLIEAGRPFRFMSFNIPNLLLVEDNVAFNVANPWRLPDAFEINDALATVAQMGGTVVRTYVITVQRPTDAPGTPRHVLGPGQFNEEAFRTLDLVLQSANQHGVRLIIPLVDNWPWMGGRIEYAGFRGKTRDDFWTDPQLIADFKQTIRFILSRTNTLTGVRYSDDPAVLCWETGNELSCPATWTREIAAYIKSLDHNHLVMDGVNTTELKPESLAMPEVDIVTTHHYPPPRKPFAQLIRENWEKAKGKKPYVVGEFGFVETEQMQAAMDAVQETGAAGGLHWSLRFRNRDGGFYWHSEPAGGNKYKAFHWPGSAMGEIYDEINLMAAIRKSAFALRGLTPPAIPIPLPPHLLPVADAAAISWQGSVGATTYVVERAPQATGPWTTAGAGLDETVMQYRPLFDDASAPAGNWFYRVRAQNAAGRSAPSNVAGPVAVSHATLVDELMDFTRTASHSEGMEIKLRDCRKAREDAHRAAGNAGDTLVYKLSSPMEGLRIFALFPKDVADLKLSVSADGKSYHPVIAGKESYFQGAGDYDYWKPVQFFAGAADKDTRFLKIELAGETQIGRVEISHALTPQ